MAVKHGSGARDLKWGSGVSPAAVFFQAGGTTQDFKFRPPDRSAAESQIRDADVAAQAANLAKAQILQQSSIGDRGRLETAPVVVN